MTLSELLHSVSFDDLIPTLKNVYGVETDIYAYREAFDELNLLRPIGRDDGNIKVYRMCIRDRYYSVIPLYAFKTSKSNYIGDFYIVDATFSVACLLYTSTSARVGRSRRCQAASPWSRTALSQARA